MKESKRIYKIEEGKKIFGVCGGLAEYFNIDPTIVRVVWAALVLAYGTGLLLYLICAFVFPNKSEVVGKVKVVKKVNEKKKDENNK